MRYKILCRPQIKKSVVKKIILNTLILGLCSSNFSIYSFANDNNIKQIKSMQVNNWATDLASMPTARYDFGSETVNGKIYCIGGTISSNIHSGGSNRSTTVTNVVEVYDPIIDKWSTKKTMPTARERFDTAVIDGKIYCIGGVTSSGSMTNIVEVYDPETDTWDTSKASMPIANSDFSSVAVDNNIYCIGGSAQGMSPAYTSAVYEYNSLTNIWTQKETLDNFTGIIKFVAEEVNDKIYVIGGETGDLFWTSDVYVYNPVTDSWDWSKTSMPTDRKQFSSVVIEDKIYCIGGNARGFNISNTIEVYDPATDNWDTSVISMPTPRFGFSSHYVNGKLYCIGGYDNSTIFNKVEVYAPKITTAPTEIELAILKAEQTNDPADIEYANLLVSQLPNSEIKEELLNRLEELSSSTTITPGNITNNIDFYIKMQNTLSLTLDTNYILFEDFDGVEDMIKENAINLTVESSLPYQVNASLETEIQNSDGTNILDKSILGIKSDNTDTYKTFSTIKTPLTLLDNQESGKINTHPIDLKLNKGVNYTVDIYKTTIKFEVIQK